MSLRKSETVAKQLRDILLELKESKSAQFVGNSQIVVKEYVSNQISVTSESTGYIAEAFASCTVSAPTIENGNVLITYCVPEVRINGALIDNKSTDAYTCHTTIVETDSDATNGYQVSIYHSSTGGEEIPSETFTVKFHIYSAAEVTVSARGGVYG